MNDTPKLCLTCATPLPAKRPKFCSHKCAMKWHNDRQVWAERADREQHNARKAALYKQHPGYNALMAKSWRARYPERYNAVKANQAIRNRRIPWAHAFKNAAMRAIKKNVAFDLTNEWAKARWTGFCEVSKLPFQSSHESGHRLFSVSIDRVVPALGYTQANSRFVCLAVNMLKHEETDLLMYKIARAIVDNYQELPSKLYPQNPDTDLAVMTS